MINAIASDVAITWLGALGCLMCSVALSRDNRTGTLRAASMLTGALTVLLTIRGFYWLLDYAALGRAVFVVATLLPLTITLFVEQLLRRHHPLWLKTAVVLATLVFFLSNLLTNLSVHPYWLIAFVTSLLVIVAANGWFLARVSPNDLSHNELQLARTILLATIVAVPLLVSDFREQFTWIPVRLGSLAALLYVYLLMSLLDHDNVMFAVMRRLSFALVIALVLAVIFATSLTATEGAFLPAVLSCLPVATACTFVAAVTVRMIEISSRNQSHTFLRWLLHARLDSVEGLVHSLKRFPQMSDYLALSGAQLSQYSLESVFAATGSRRGPISLADAQSWLRQDNRRKEAAEQLIDLLERHEMTHALPISLDPPLIVLLNLPRGAYAAIGQLRAGVVQRLAQRLSEFGKSND